MDEFRFRKRGDDYRIFAGASNAHWVRRSHNDPVRNLFAFLGWFARMVGLAVLLAIIFGCMCISALLLWPAPN